VQALPLPPHAQRLGQAAAARYVVLGAAADPGQARRLGAGGSAEVICTPSRMADCGWHAQPVLLTIGAAFCFAPRASPAAFWTWSWLEASGQRPAHAETHLRSSTEQCMRLRRGAPYVDFGLAPVDAESVSSLSRHVGTDVCFSGLPAFVRTSLYDPINPSFPPLA
jgi:hypothetical protein